MQRGAGVGYSGHPPNHRGPSGVTYGQQQQQQQMTQRVLSPTPSALATLAKTATIAQNTHTKPNLGYAELIMEAFRVKSVRTLDADTIIKTIKVLHPYYRNATPKELEVPIKLTLTVNKKFERQATLSGTHYGKQKQMWYVTNGALVTGTPESVQRPSAQVLPALWIFSKRFCARVSCLCVVHASRDKSCVWSCTHTQKKKNRNGSIRMNSFLKWNRHVMGGSM